MRISERIAVVAAFVFQGGPVAFVVRVVDHVREQVELQNETVDLAVGLLFNLDALVRIHVESDDFALGRQLAHLFEVVVERQALLQLLLAELEAVFAHLVRPVFVELLLDEVQEVSFALRQPDVLHISRGAAHAVFENGVLRFGLRLRLVGHVAHVDLDVDLVELLVVAAGPLVRKNLLEEFLVVVVHLLLVLPSDAVVTSHGTPAVGHRTVYSSEIEGAPLHLLLTFALHGFLGRWTLVIIVYRLAVGF